MIKVRAKKNANEIIENLIAEYQHKSFVWGSRDCMLFMADVILAISGVDVAKDIRGRYTSDLSAKRFALTYCESRSLSHLASTVFNEYDGIVEGDSSNAMKVAIVEIGGVKYGGVMRVEDKYVFTFQPKGFVVTPSRNIVRQWGIKWQS